MVDPTRGTVPHLPSPSDDFGTQDALVPHEDDLEPDLDGSLDVRFDDDAAWFDDTLTATGAEDVLIEPPSRWRLGTLPSVVLFVAPVVLLLGFGFGTATLWSAEAVLTDEGPAAVDPTPRAEPAVIEVGEAIEVDAPSPVVEADAGEVDAGAEAEVAVTASPPSAAPAYAPEPEAEPAPPADPEVSEAASVWSSLPAEAAAPVQDVEASTEDSQDEAPRRGLLNRLKKK